ncbi:MAG: hypothetical protein IJ722_00835 [Alloprevotella sp.]|nr:hypothetical protein [Alloprevotella sp.]
MAKTKQKGKEKTKFASLECCEVTHIAEESYGEEKETFVLRFPHLTVTSAHN